MVAHPVLLASETLLRVHPFTIMGNSIQKYRRVEKYQPAEKYRRAE